MTINCIFQRTIKFDFDGDNFFVENRIMPGLLVSYSSDNPGDLEDLYIQYFNRLSDYLFVVSRYCNLLEGAEEILWKS